MNNYMSVQSFLTMVDGIKNIIYRQIKNENHDRILNVTITHGLYKDGEQINLNDKQLKEICLVDEEPEIYGSDISKTLTDITNHNIHVHLLFNARDVVFQGENRLKLKQCSYVFDTYEDYLKLLTTQFNRHINSWFCAKN